MTHSLSKKSRIAFALLAGTAFLTLFVRCSGEECAAISTFQTDFDSDCIPDTEDNCLLAENPGGSYNPNQFDNDEDGVGPPCDSDDNDDTVVGVSLIKETSFNMGGDYRFPEAECGIDFATVAQNENLVLFRDNLDNTHSGTAELSADGSRMTALFTMDDNTVCTLELDAIDVTAVLSCADIEGTALCTSSGNRFQTQLWQDLETW